MVKNSGWFKENIEHPLWKGDKATRKAFHIWLQTHFGKASKCESTTCSKKSKTYQWANIKEHKYSHKREDYKELCVSCHRLLDKKGVCNKGHVLTPENSYVKPSNGDRSCRICRQNYWRKWALKHNRKVRV